MITLKPFRRAAVPLLAVQTADPAEIRRLVLAECVNGATCPVLGWDCLHGITALNTEGQPIADSLNGGQPASAATGNPAEALRALETCEPMVLTVAYGMADLLADPQSATILKQALWNLRDANTSHGSLFVMTVPLGWRNPFPDDVAVIVSPLPGQSDLELVVDKIVKDNSIDVPAENDKQRMSDALLGLSNFAAEQALSLSATKKGIDVQALWARKRQQISETSGLSIYAGGETFADLGGLEQAKNLFRALMNGKRKPGAVVFIDEIEKALAGSAGDSSGVSQSILGYLLSYMQDQNATGSIFIGPPGAAKSALAKAIGNEGEVPTVCLDLGGVKGSLVGESEQRMRTALAVVTAVSAGRPLFIATCNAISVLPPELRRRFTIGTLFFDLPSSEERGLIWDIYVKKYGLKFGAFPKAEGWTGAEIKQCCDLADRLELSLLEAAKYVVPVSVSAREKIAALRQEASGRYLSASGTGLYVASKVTAVTSAGRNLNNVE